MYDRTLECGVAMKNAKEVAKSSAKMALDKSNDEDGVACYDEDGVACYIIQEFCL